MRKKLTMFVTGFVMMLVAGAAAAQIGVWEAPGVDLFSTERPGAFMPAPEIEPGSETAADEVDAMRAGAGAEKAAVRAEGEVTDKREVATRAGDATRPAEAETEETAAREAESKEEADTTPPEIVILHPTEGQVFEQTKVAYEGTTEPGARVFAGDYEAEVDADGGFRIVLILGEGANTTRLVAKDAAGNTSSATVTAIYEPPASETSKQRGFTAYQKFHETAEGYEKFFGTANAGSQITVTTDGHGSAVTTVGDHGEWAVKLPFEAKPGTVFLATVRDSEGHSKTFEVKVLEKVVKEFSAFQKYGSCSESPPYDVFFGTGVPGTVVEIGSPYGGGRTVIGEAGGWDMKVVFEGAPIGVTFEVVLETSAGHRMVFPFTRRQGDAGT